MLKLISAVKSDIIVQIIIRNQCKFEQDCAASEVLYAILERPYNEISRDKNRWIFKQLYKMLLGIRKQRKG